MPDITMCKPQYCELREHCYRYMAIPNEYWQSYADFSYDRNNDTKNDKCKHWIAYSDYHLSDCG